MMMNFARARVVLAIFAIVLLASAPGAFAQEAQVGDCDCGYGKVVEASPCVCQCDEGYYRPRCIFKIDERVTVRTILNVSDDKFVGGSRFEEEVRVGMGFSPFTSMITFRGREDNTTEAGLELTRRYPNHIYVQLGVMANNTQKLLDEVSLKKPWTVLQHIVHAEVLDLGASAANSLVDTQIAAIEFTVNGEKVIARVSVNTIGWLIGIFVMIIVLCIPECIFYKNNVKTINSKMEAEQNEPHSEGGEKDKEFSPNAVQDSEMKERESEQPVQGVVVQESSAEKESAPVPEAEAEKEAAPVPEAEESKRASPANSAASAVQSGGDDDDV